MASQLPGAPAAEQVAAFSQKHRSGLVTLLFADLVGSTELKQRAGDAPGLRLIDQHHAAVRELLRQFIGAEEISTAGDSFFLVFARPSDAVRFALRLQARLRQLAEETGLRLQDRVGIHAGEVFERENAEAVVVKDLGGLHVDLCARVMSLAHGGQVLMTRFVFDNARQVLKGEELPGAGPLSWLNHGLYQLKGIEEPVEVCEVGEVGRSPLRAPATTEKGRRFEVTEGEPVLGWRPAVGQEVPNTPWVLEEKLGEGGFGEVWRGRHRKLKEDRVFKFCFRADRVRSLKREMTLFRLLKERVGEHPNIVRLHEVYLDEPPFYLEEEFVEGKDLKTWCEAQGGIEKVPLETRLEIVAQVADALQAAHDAGVIHRDVKPGNILISGEWQVTSGEKEAEPREVTSPRSSLVTRHSSLSVKLTDFGIGQVVSAEVLAGMTRAGFTQTMLSSSSSQTGTQLYMAPELLAGKPATTRSDIYSLGVVLLQLLLGDFKRPVTGDWAEEIQDPLLRDDLKHCLAGKPEDRFIGAGQLAKNLRGWEQRKSELARQQADQAERERLRQQAQKGRRLLLATGAVAAVLVALAIALGYGLRKAKREAYYSNIALADQHIREGDISRAQTLLLKCPPKYRHWEWGRLMYLCHQDVLSFQAHSNAFTEEFNTRTVRSLVFSPNGKLLATAGNDGWAKVWDAQLGREVFAFGGSSNRVECLAFSPDGRQLLFGTRQGVISVRDTATWREALSFQAHTGSVQQIVYRPDGSQFTTRGADNVAKVWDTRTGQRIHQLDPGALPLRGVSYSPDGRRLLTHTPTAAKVWDPSTGKELASRTVSGDEYRSLIADPDGERFVTIDTARRVKLWLDEKAGRDLGTIRGAQPNELLKVFFSRDGTRFCTGGEDGTARVWNALTGAELLSIPSRVFDAVFSPDGACVATIGSRATATIWDVSNGRELLTLRGHDAIIDAITFSPDGRRIATASRDGVVKLWSASPGREVLRGDAWMWGAAFSPDGQRVAAAPWNRQFKIWDAQSGQCLLTVNTDWHAVLSCVFSPDGRRLLTAGDDRTARVWDAQTGQELLLLRGHARVLYHAVFSPDGRWIATGSIDGTARLWSAETGELVHNLEGHLKPVGQIAFSPDGRQLVTGSDDLTAKVWEVASGRLLRTFTEPSGGTATACFSPDGRMLATGGGEKTLRLLDARSGALVQTWKTRAFVINMTFSPDGKRLVVLATENSTYGYDRPTDEIWDVETGRPILTLHGHTEPTSFVSFAPDGQRIMTSSYDMTSRLWEAFPWREEEYPSTASNSGGTSSASPTNKGPRGTRPAEAQILNSEISRSLAASVNFAGRIQLYARDYWRRRLAVEDDAAAKGGSAHVEVTQAPDRSLWPKRDAQATANQVDLTEHYTGLLTTELYPNFRPDYSDNDLRALPSGTVSLADVPFDVRGVIQLRRTELLGRAFELNWRRYPERVEGIRVGRAFHRLHVLLGAESTEADGKSIGAFVLHYAEGTQRELAIAYGRDVRNWWAKEDPKQETERAVVAWTGTNPVAESRAPDMVSRKNVRFSPYEASRMA